MKGYKIYCPESPEGKNLLALHNLTEHDIYKATKWYARKEGVRVGTILGIGADGWVASSREDRHPELADAFDEVFIIVPWIQIYELLGRVPDRAVADLLGDKNGNRH
jgi:hypothetical protein